MKRTEIIPAVEEIIKAAKPSAAVICDNFSKAAAEAMEQALLDVGYCYAIKPLLGGKKLSQAGERVTEHVDFSVHVRVNTSKGKDFDTYSAQDDIIAALCGNMKLQAQAGSSDRQEVSVLVPEDVGCLTHALLFHVKITNR